MRNRIKQNHLKIQKALNKKITRRISKIAFILIASSLVFLSCASRPEIERANFSAIEMSNKKFEWQELEKGLWLSTLYYENYPLIVHAVKIDLSNPKLKIVSTDEKRFDTGGKVKMQTTMQFAKKHNTLIASVANFFYTKSYIFSSRARILGLYMSNGKTLNPAHKNFGSVYFFKDNSALISDAGEVFEKKDISTSVNKAISGRKMILKNGKAIITGLHPIEDSRTCLGLAKDRKSLYLVFIEAENKRKSRGITYDQTAFFMKKLGATDAIQLDGGGSSSLIVKQNGKQKIIAPSISNLGLRRVAVNIGFIIEK